MLLNLEIPEGEIDLFLFKDEPLFEMVKELLEPSYTLTILYFHHIDKVDEYNYTLI